MRIWLEKKEVLQLYCFTLQGECSIAFALGAPWPELRAFYQGQRLETLRPFTRNTLERASCFGIPLPSLPRNELGPYFPSVNLVQYLLGKWMNNWKRRWSFTAQVFGFMAGSLEKLVRTLESEDRPDQDALISLRMDLCTGRSAIEDRCYGLAELKVAKRIEHFWQADWIIPVRIEEVVGKLEVPGMAGKRKSA